MINKINYPQIFPSISEGRIKAIKAAFETTSTDVLTNRQYYGIFMWSQKSSASIYPLLQQLEITLRNSIDIMLCFNKCGHFDKGIYSPLK